MALGLCVVSQKGGVGKTTVALNLAFAMASRNHRVLLIDSDPQGGVGYALARKGSASKGLTDIVSRREWVPSAVTKTRIACLDLLLTGRVDVTETSAFQNELQTNRVFDTIRKSIDSEYDLVMIDTAPGFGNGTVAALKASNYFISPIQAEPGSLRSLPRLLEMLASLRARQYAIRCAGFLINMVQQRNDDSLAVMREIWQQLPERLLFHTVIPRSEAFLKAGTLGLPLGLMKKNGPAILSIFDRLAIELESKIDLTRKEIEDEPTSLFT